MTTVFRLPLARRLAGLLLAAAAWGGPALHAQPRTPHPAPPAPPSQLAAYVRQFARAGQFQGAVLVADQHRVLWQQGFGPADRGRAEANTATTRFRIGSLSKQFTAVLVLQLVEQGRLRLDGAVADYLPAYPLPMGRQITLHQLLTHTAGLPDYTRLPQLAGESTRLHTPGQLVALFAGLPLEFAPGTRFQYSNSGYVLLGAILEQVTGQPYAQLLRERIARPLHLQATSYEPEAWPTGPGTATGYQAGADSLVLAPPLHPSVAYAAGGLVSSAADLYRWSEALDGPRLLTAASRQQLFTPGRGSYAYGWSVFATTVGPDSVRLQEHNGAINGFASYLVREPASGRCLVLLDNHSGTAPLPGLRQGLLRLLHQLPASPPAALAPPAAAAASATGSPSADQLASYVGVYELAPTFRITVRQRAGRLYVQATGQGEFATQATSPVLFALQGVPAQVEFVADARGQVVQLVLHQGGRDLPGAKIE